MNELKEYGQFIFRVFCATIFQQYPYINVFFISYICWLQSGFKGYHPFSSKERPLKYEPINLHQMLILVLDQHSKYTTNTFILYHISLDQIPYFNLNPISVKILYLYHTTPYINNTLSIKYKTKQNKTTPMLGTLKCQICLDNFDNKRICPRVCVGCGHTVCQKCLIDIKYRTQILKCPFCKNSTKDIWPKNLTILTILEFNETASICEKHQRATVSLCASKDCPHPVAICDLGECSKIHKQKGTNNIPLSLLGVSCSGTKQKQNSLNVIQAFYGSAEKQLSNLLRDKKINSNIFGVQNKSISTKFKKETNAIITKIMSGQLKDITSCQLANVKQDILENQQDDSADLQSKNQEIVKAEKEELIICITKLLRELKIDLVPKEFYQQSAKIKQIQLSPAFDLVQRVIGRKISPYLLFDSTVHTNLVFRSRIVGQPNIAFYIELQDGTTFGAYFKRTFTKYFYEDRRMIDFDSFVFWLNQGQVYKASTLSISNYDMGPQYYFSVGNTNNWDGFWFKTTFKQINEDSNKMVIKSSQFQKLQIPLKTKNVKVFQTYQLDMQ